MREYILISQQEHRIMQYTKTEAGWLLSEYEAESTIYLPAIAFDLDSAATYAGIDFNES